MWDAVNTQRFCTFVLACFSREHASDVEGNHCTRIDKHTNRKCHERSCDYPDGIETREILK